MGGSIEVESELGAGTTFTLYLDFERISIEDVKQEEITERMQKSETYKELTGKRILLAEDHALNAEIATKLLERVGCKIVWAKDGEECVTLYEESQKNPYDIILMDIRMPKKTGLEAARAIRSKELCDSNSIPIIAMTANAYKEDIDLSLKAGMNAHLAKPINPHILYETLCKYINAKLDKE